MRASLKRAAQTVADSADQACTDLAGTLPLIAVSLSVIAAMIAIGVIVYVIRR